MKINRTWLASHAGPIERGQLGRCPRARRRDRALMPCGYSRCRWSTRPRGATTRPRWDRPAWHYIRAPDILQRAPSRAESGTARLGGNDS